MFYYFLVELLTFYDVTKFHGHWSSNKEITQGGRIPPSPAVLDSKKPGWFRVKEKEKLLFKVRRNDMER